jgi:mannose-6-phosphate isomerase
MEQKVKRPALLKNTVQDYAWGSSTAIPQLLGEKNPSGKPQAELWMGAHPKAPSLVDCGGQWRSLQELIENYPQDILGDKIADKFHNKLPFLFKVLAAAKPLSIQAHPGLSQAIEGFRRENAEGIPMNASNRNYKDANHKPECICALSPFWALYGFRNVSEILALTKKSCPVGLANEINGLMSQRDSQGLKRYFTHLMTLDADRQKKVIDEAVQNALQFSDEDDAFYWMIRLSDEYPVDIGILSPILLNIVQLTPGQALFLPAGELHAYLEGFGIELMANSDNVLRGGLTPKHIDITELLKVLNFEPRTINVLEAVQKNKAERMYACPADEFVLSVISVSDEFRYQCKETRSVEIVLCTDGKTFLKDNGSKDLIELAKGTSAIIPAAVKSYCLSGNGTLFKASVPI